MRRLLDLVTLPSGQVDPTMEPYCDQPLVAPNHIEPGTGRLLAIETAKAQRAESGKYTFRAGDVLYSKIRPHLKKATLVSFDGLCSADMYPLRPSQDVHPGWVLAVLLGDEFSKFAVAASGRTGIPKINREELGEFRVATPPPREQRGIAAALMAADTAIAAGMAMVEQLEHLGRSLVEDLLRNGLVRRGRGTEAWSQGTLGEHLREPIRNGYSPVCPTKPTGRWTLGLGAVTPEGFCPAGKKPAPPDDPQVHAARLLPGDVLVSRSNTRDRVGLAGVYKGDPPECSYPDLLMRVRPAECLLPEFLECQLLAFSGRRYFQTAARGTSGSMVKINRGILEAFPVVIPPLDEQQSIVDAVGAVTARLEKERAVVAERLRLKGALADALLLGKIRVPEARSV